MAQKGLVAVGLCVGSVLAASLALYSCADDPKPPPAPVPAAAPAPAPPPPAPVVPAKPPGALPTLLVVQAWFKKIDGKMVPQPARLIFRQTDGTQWWTSELLDPDSNVFHKAMPWRDGVLTIGAEKAMIKHWKLDGSEWKAKVIYENSWGGKFDRFRDVEIGDLDGDGRDELALATHDQGVVAVGREGEDGAWAFQEFDKTPDIFVHEVEIGDVDGDGKKEFYVTPSERNRASGESQPGGVARYDHDGATSYVRKQVVQWPESHAKEILVADLDADGTDELYVVKEGHVVKNEAGQAELKDPVRIVRMIPEAAGWKEVVVATLDGDKQCRFLTRGDVDGDGQLELVAAGMDTGLWVLQRQPDGTFKNELVASDSGGFEHATHLADLDGNGTLEIYVASDKQREFRSYTWSGAAWEKKVIAGVTDNPAPITWNIQDGRLEIP